MFRVGLVGCGGIGKTHMNNWKTIEGVSVEVVCDLNEEKAKAAGEQFNCRWTTDIADLGELDAVSVATPPQAHYSAVKKLLEAGYNVFSEKPLTLNVEEGKELDALAKAKNLKLGVGFKMRFEPVFVKARELLPEIGELMHISTTKLQAFNPRPEGAWVKKTGAMYELSIHDFDLLAFITGRKFEKILFSRLNHRLGWEADDGFTIAAEFEGGIVALLEGLYSDTCPFEYRDFCAVFSGTKGYMRVERPDRVVMHTGSTHHVVEVADDDKSAFYRELAHFKAVIEGKEELTLTAEKAINMTDLVESAKANNR